MRLKKNIYLDIHRAIIEKDYIKVKNLLKNDISPDKQTGNKNTPLHIAAMKKDLYVMQLLKKYNANPNLENSHESTSLHIAANKKDSLEMVRLLLKMGTKINKTDRYLNTPLHIAIRNHANIKVIKLLLNSGANPNAVNSNFETPLSIAKKNNNTVCMKLLTTHGAGFKSNRSKLLKLALITMPTYKKILLVCFSITIISVAIAISILTSGKTIMGIVFAILTSLGLIVICLGDQYYKIQEVKRKKVKKKTIDSSKSKKRV